LQVRGSCALQPAWRVLHATGQQGVPGGADASEYGKAEAPRAARRERNAVQGFEWCELACGRKGDGKECKVERKVVHEVLLVRCEAMHRAGYSASAFSMCQVTYMEGAHNILP
jgi:hypothetical protein